MPQSCATQPDLILWDVVEEHFDEASFLFEQWERSLNSPKYKLTGLRQIERRLDAHVDGLVVGGSEVSRHLLEPALADAGDAPHAAAAALALLYGDEKAAGQIVDAALRGGAKLRNPLMRAVSLAGITGINEILTRRLRSAETDSARAALLDSLTFRGIQAGEFTMRWATSDDLELAAAVLRTCARFGGREMLALAESHLRPGDSLAGTAFRASLTLGSQRAWAICREWARGNGADSREPQLLLALLGEKQDHEFLLLRLDESPHPEYLLWLSGFVGTPAAVEACMDRIADGNPRVAKAAAEAMAWITGLDLYNPQYRNPHGEVAEEETLPPLEEDDLDADLGLDALDGVPPPNCEAIRRWWDKNRSRFAPGERYLLGRAHSPESMVHALEAGSLRRRHGLALEIAIQSGGRHVVSTESFSSRQRKQIAMLSAEPVAADGR